MRAHYLTQALFGIHTQNLFFETDVEKYRVAVLPLVRWNHDYRRRLFIGFYDTVDQIRADLRLINERQYACPSVFGHSVNTALDRRGHARLISGVVRESDGAITDRAPHLGFAMAGHYDDLVGARGKEVIYTVFDETLIAEPE